MIRMHFPDVADSPTLRTPVRIRYAMAKQQNGRTVPELLYAHGTRRLTRDAWQGFAAAGATIGASTEREAHILCEVLGIDGFSIRVDLDEPADQASATP